MTRSCSSTARRIPGTARIGQIDSTGFDGAITMRSADLIASTTPGAGAAAIVPSKTTLRTVSRWPRWTKYC